MENMDAQPIGEVKSSPRMEQISESKADSNGSMNGYDGRDELISELSLTVLNNMATIGELEKANTFLKYKLKYQTAEAEKAAKKAQDRISKLQEEIARLTKACKENGSSPSKADIAASPHDPVHRQRWPEVLQNPENAVKLTPKQLLAAPRNRWSNASGHGYHNNNIKTPSKVYSGAFASANGLDDRSSSPADMAAIYETPTKEEISPLAGNVPFQNVVHKDGMGHR